MAKKPADTKATKPAAAEVPVKDRIVDALMALAGETAWEEISLPMIAGRAGITLADLRDHYPSKGAILSGFARRIDRIVLDGTTADMADEPARERLLDIMLRRLDALAPYKPALKPIRRALMRDPLSLAAANQLALNSWRYMLAAADIDTEDHLATIRLQGAVLIFNRVLDVWFEDDSDDMAKTMAKLDKELQSGERIMGRIGDLNRLAAPFTGFIRAAMERRNDMRGRSRRDEGEAPVNG
jgi:AcrR family transcriptional regulator